MRHLLPLAALLLCGCASSSYVDAYNGTPWQTFDGYRLRDKSDERRLMLMPDPATATGQRFMTLTFGTGPVDRPKPVIEGAAMRYLASTGRVKCRLVDAYLVESPAWEVKYACAS